MQSNWSWFEMSCHLKLSWFQTYNTLWLYNLLNEKSVAKYHWNTSNRTNSLISVNIYHQRANVAKLQNDIRDIKLYSFKMQHWRDKKSQNCIIRRKNNSLLLRASKNGNISANILSYNGSYFIFGRKGMFFKLYNLYYQRHFCQILCGVISSEKRQETLSAIPTLFISYVSLGVLNVDKLVSFFTHFSIYKSIKTSKLKTIKIGKLNDKMRNILRIQISVINKSAKVECANLVLMCKL